MLNYVSRFPVNVILRFHKMHLNKGNILITGATGFIGREVSTFLREGGWKVGESTRRKVDDAHQVFLDLTNPESVFKIWRNRKFDAIVHLGARIGWSGESETDLFVPNVLSTAILANCAKETDARFIFASAAIVHGKNAEYIDSETPLNPDTPYAKSKLLAEGLIVSSGVNHCIMRIGGVFGANGPSHLGINNAISRARAQEVPHILKQGGQLRNYIYNKDVAIAIGHILKERLEGVHLMAGTQELSVRAMLEEVCEVFMPGVSPSQSAGSGASDQVIASSDSLPKTRDFKSALEDIHDQMTA
jgi:UDP-glucose 4-epimerase